MYVHRKFKMKTKRETTQFLAPTKCAPSAKGKYDIYPTFDLGSSKIMVGADRLTKLLIEQGCRSIIVDGYVGVFWDELANQIAAQCKALGKTVTIYRTEDYFVPKSQIDKMAAPYLNGDDPVFGKITDLRLEDWFADEFFELKNSPLETDILIVIGCGAALCGVQGRLVYVDLPKNELQFRMRAGAANNLGSNSASNTKQAYKRFYFVDWVVLNHHKCNVLPRIDYFVDGQHPEAPTFASGEAVRGGLKKMSQSYFRPRPWFEPGAWGGTWMRENIEGLNRDVPNLAWSFELMVLENGLLLASDSVMLEVSFDTLMFAEYENVLGRSAARFKYDFPIRFDYLDTFDGGNLSVQCHPRPEYIKAEFGMSFTQDETYYILDCKNDPQVYLGFQEGIDPAEFEAALNRSQKEGKAIDIEQFVQKLPAKKHDLFLIPNGTIHGSGTDNMVLEISSAPYIFTFKMYDWMRLDLDGKPRPINIEHGMRNLYFDRCGDKVQQELISHPVVEIDNADLKREHLPTHKEHFYDIYRHTFHTNLNIKGNGHAHVWMVVEGSSVTLHTQNGMAQRFNYAETFVVPAAAGHYRLESDDNQSVMMVQCFVKDSHI